MKEEGSATCDLLVGVVRRAFVVVDAGDEELTIHQLEDRLPHDEPPFGLAEVGQIDGPKGTTRGVSAVG